MSGGLCIAIMAAGAARRFAGPKLDVEFASKRLGRHALDSALELGAKNLVIVVGDPCPQFARDAEVEGLVSLLVNPKADRGLSGSVALAAGYAAKSKSERLLLMLGDMPFVTSATLRRLVATASAGSPSAVRYPCGAVGIPVCLTADHFDDLLSLRGERGASSYLNGMPQCRKIDVPARELADIDTRVDLDTFSITP